MQKWCLPDAVDDPAVGASDKYDGIGLIWFRSPETRRSHFADVGARTMGRDEEDVFGVAIKDADLFAEEHLLLQRERKDGVAGWLWAAAGLVVLVCSGVLVLALGWGDSRYARSGGAVRPHQRQRVDA